MKSAREIANEFATLFYSDEKAWLDRLEAAIATAQREAWKSAIELASDTCRRYESSQPTYAYAARVMASSCAQAVHAIPFPEEPR